jgi:hypothetical protein
MSDEIINKVANSGLINIDLEDFYPKVALMEFDLKPFLWQELILKEKDFREQLKNHDFTQYQNKAVAIHCSADAIVPSWAYILVASHLQPFATHITHGKKETLLEELYSKTISELDITPYQDGRIIVKGCSDKAVPQSAYIKLIEKLQPVAKSIMYGEACSTVPLFKRK